MKIKNRLAYLEDEIKQIDWTKESPKHFRNALAGIIKTARQLAKEILREEKEHRLQRDRAQRREYQPVEKDW